MKPQARWTTALIVMFALVLSLTGIATAEGGKGNAYGTAQPFSLSLQALLGKDGTTDLYVNLSPSAGYAAPNTLNKVQLKSFTEDGTLVYTKNLLGVASPAGRANIKLQDLKRMQPLQTQVNVKTAQTQDEKVLKAATKVLLRPDLAVGTVTAPAKAFTNVPFSVNVPVQEKNGDVGASTNVRIKNGATVLDHADALQVEPGASKSLAFALKFAEPGTYTLTVAADDVSLGDYDPGNNTTTFTVEVVTPNQPMQFYATYQYEHSSYNSDYAYPWGETESYRNEYAGENFSLWAYTPDQISLNGQYTVKLTADNGRNMTITLSDGYSYDPATNAYGWLGATPWGTYVTLNTYAGHWTYSYNFSSWWNYAYSESWGVELRAEHAVAGVFDIPAANGTHYGGNFSVNLTGYDYSWDYSWTDWWYWYYGGAQIHEWGSYARAWGWNQGTTTW